MSLKMMVKILGFISKFPDFSAIFRLVSFYCIVQTDAIVYFPLIFLLKPEIESTLGTPKNWQQYPTVASQHFFDIYIYICIYIYIAIGNGLVC